MLPAPALLGLRHGSLTASLPLLLNLTLHLGQLPGEEGEEGEEEGGGRREEKGEEGEEGGGGRWKRGWVVLVSVHSK